MTKLDQPIETPRAQRVEDFRRRILPVVVWSAAALVAVAMMWSRSPGYQHIGIAQSVEYEISAHTNGTLDTVVVALFDQIEEGDIVAKLDDSPLVASIGTSNASIRQLSAELDAMRTQLLSESGQGHAAWTVDLRRFQIDEERRRLDLLALKVVVESDEVEAERLALEERRSSRLLDAGLIGEMDHGAVRLELAQVRRRIQESRVLMVETGEELHQAEIRRKEFEDQLPIQPGVEPALKPLREAIAVESGRLTEIELQREALVLRSPVSGQVSQILCRTGQSVVPGEPIVMIAERSVRDIVAFIIEPEARTVEPNTPVLVASRANPTRVAESVVVRVGPNVGTLPQRVWRDPRVPSYGRSVLIAGVPALDLTPGELVTVQFRSD